jgi:hypothetical protein
MAGTNPKVRIIVACAYGDVGHEFVPNGVTRDWLLANKYAELVEAETPGRPAKLGAKALQKLTDAGKKLL